MDSSGTVGRWNVLQARDQGSSAPIEDDAQRAFDFAEALTEIMYVLPSRIPPKQPGV